MKYLTSLTLALCSLILETNARNIARTAPPNHGFERRWLAPREGSIRLHIALRQQDGGAGIERQLLQASDPNSAGFRQHLTAHEANQKSAPAEGSSRAVESWLREHGMAQDASIFNGMFEVETTIRKAERLLNATYFVFSDGVKNVIRTERYHIPENVARHIDFVTPTTIFPGLSQKKPSGGPSRASEKQMQLERKSSCGSNDDTTPACIRQVYGLDYMAVPNRTTFAVYATEGASFSANDLHTYLEQYNPPAAAASATYQVSGKGDPAEGGGIEAQFETALDTQTLLGLAWPAQGILYNRGGVFGPNASQTYDPFVQFLTELANNETVPSVVSFSESMPEDRLDPDYAKRLCNMMALIGTRGVTLLFSAGNNGPNGDQPSGLHTQIFEPVFPASCLWITAVGGTTNLASEEAATQSTITGLSKAGYTSSGGGFSGSNYFPVPAWQKPHTDAYINKYVPRAYFNEPSFNPYGRGIPDVSAFSTAFPTVVGILHVPVGGTSAATPTWAAVITLLNDYEASKGRPTLGFLNPWLYSLKSGLKDITTGGNNVGQCNSFEGCTLSKPLLGYNVSEGWDPVTGLGSPLWKELVKALDVGGA